jgi:MFS family permease
MTEADATTGSAEHSSDAAVATDRGKWMALWAALLGWMFDGFEQGMFSLVGRPAFADLLAGSGRQGQVSQWFAVIMAIFLIGAAAGGVLFGWLGDRIGRVRAMSFSILTYAIFTGLCGFATQPWHLAVLRFVASLGIGGEWALGVALVIEIWPDKSRAFVAGLIGASANAGFFLVGLLGLVVVRFVDRLAGWLSALGLSENVTGWLLSGEGSGRGWRLLMISGALPALLIFFIRLFVPESQRWERENRRGATSHWATADLLGVLVGSAGAALVIFVWSPASERWDDFRSAARLAGTTSGIVLALVGFMFPVVRYLQRATAAGSLPAGSAGPLVRRMLLGASLAGVALLGTWGSIQWAAKWADALSRGTPQQLHAAAYTQLAVAGGAIVGTVCAALLAGRLGRRLTYALLCAGSLASSLLLYQTNRSYGPQFLACVLLAGGVTSAFYGWFPLYLPELFRTSVRATSQGFAYNFGRIIAAIGALQTAALMAWFTDPTWTPQQAEMLSFPKAASVLSLIYLVGLVIIWFGPETKGKPLPE